jgi:hypothetical protein
MGDDDDGVMGVGWLALVRLTLAQKSIALVTQNKTTRDTARQHKKRYKFKVICVTLIFTTSSDLPPSSILESL